MNGYYLISVIFIIIVFYITTQKVKQSKRRYKTIYDYDTDTIYDVIWQWKWFEDYGQFFADALKPICPECKNELRFQPMIDFKYRLVCDKCKYDLTVKESWEEYENKIVKEIERRARIMNLQ